MKVEKHTLHRIKDTARRTKLASVFVLLLLCMLISCPLKRELRAWMGIPSVEHTVPKQAALLSNLPQSFQSITDNCRAEFAVLDHIELGSVQAQVLLQNPLAFFLALALPGLLFLLYGSGETASYTKYCGFPLQTSIPLFLRLRKIIV